MLARNQNFPSVEIYQEEATQLTFTCSKSTIKTLEEGVKYVDFEQVNVSWVLLYQSYTAW